MDGRSRKGGRGSAAACQRAWCRSILLHRPKLSWTTGMGRGGWLHTGCSRHGRLGRPCQVPSAVACGPCAALQLTCLALLHRNTQPHAAACLPPARWFTQWCQHTGFAYDPAHKRARVEALEQPGPRPGPIDNSDLLAQPPVG